MDAKHAVKALFDLILKNTEGFSLLICVIRAGRFDAGLEKNYKLFVEGLVEGKIPVILVLTQCDIGPTGGPTEDLEEWITHNKAWIDKYGFRFKDIVSTAWASSNKPAFEALYKEFRVISKEKAIKSIISNSLQGNVSFVRKGITETLRRVWNFIVSQAKILSLNLPYWMGKLGEVLISMGFTKAEAAVMEASLVIRD